MYNPDRWVIVKIVLKDEVIFKVLGGWSGSYLEGQSWRMNSGIVKVSQEGDYYLFEGSSGSVYKCHKKGYGTNMITSGIVNELLAQKKYKVEIMEDQDFSTLQVA